jgi:seryl-tRNA synthetase
MTSSKLETGKFTAPGLLWMDNGQSVLSGKLLELFRRLDQHFLAWAAQWQAEEYLFPTFVSAKELNKLDYFRNFPHLVTFPISLDQEEDNVEAFRTGEPVDSHGCLHLTKTAPINDVLTPAACYHIYIALQGQKFNQTKYVTTRNTCFRKEIEYHPLQRQWSFSMREIVCIGSAKDVQEYLKSFQDMLQEYFAKIGLPVTFENATDPFFKPASSGKHLMQKLDPVKTELIFDKKLAIGSLNYHRSYFGETFDLQNDGPLSTGCVAFGLERWLYAILTTFGQDFGKHPI